MTSDPEGEITPVEGINDRPSGEALKIPPGVPDIMKKMFLKLIEKLEKGPSKNRITINIDLYESLIASDLDLIQKNFPECSIGSYPYFNNVTKRGGVNIVISLIFELRAWILPNVVSHESNMTYSEPTNPC